MNTTSLRNILLPGLYGKMHVAREETLLGTYADVFSLRKATRNVERASFLMVPKNVALHEDISDSQHFVWNHTIESVGRYFGIVPDEDPRGVSAEDADVVSDKDPAALKPVKWSECMKVVDRLVDALKVAREKDAAKVFNQAAVYDPTIGGDGVCLCSLYHPWGAGQDGGVWANTFQTHQDLNLQALEEAMGHIASKYVDDAGLRIRIKAKTLLVPPELANKAQPLAERMDLKMISWKYLESKRKWFLLTYVDGLLWFERDPFELDAYVDFPADMLLVKGHDRRKFGYIDPRAVFGSLPTG